jgi:UbiD family decarboxylase
MAGEPPTDELGLVGAVRGSAVPVVKCVTSDIRVPADAEYVIEGYFDERGLVEQEGPYGEFLGYYGAMKRNPVFHATAITARRDALFQTVTISGSLISRTEAAVIGVVKTEASIWSILSQAVREPVAVCCTGSSGGMFNVRVAMNQRYPGEARNAIAALHASLGDVKNAFIVDADIDVFNDEQMDWAMATRFQGDRDLVVSSSFRTMPLDPSLDGKRTGSKVGFDLTKPFGSTALTTSVSYPPAPQVKPHRSVLDALRAGPRTFLELMEETGSRDGREIVRELGGLYERSMLQRDDDGRYVLTASP